MAQARNIASQIDDWQKRRRLSDAAAAHALELSPALFIHWKAGNLCPYPAIIETKMGVPVEKVTRTPGGIITI